MSANANTSAGPWLGLAAILMLAGSMAARAGDVTTQDEYSKRLKAYETIEPGGATPFGEEIGLYTGELSFTQNDVVVPGIGPTIVLGRSTATSQVDVGGATPAFGSWALSVPRIETLVRTPSHKPTGLGTPGGNWRTGPAGTNGDYSRCSYFDAPIHADESWWHGMELVTEDGNRQPLMGRSALNGSSPTMTLASGQRMVFPGVTSGNWQIGCLPRTTNGEVGEAFMAVSPEGTRYHLTHLVGSRANHVYEWVTELNAPLRTGRMLVMMMVTRIEDRFGNYLDYQYSGDKLIAITASDGRVVRVSWRADAPVIASITAQPGTNPQRTWQYEYTGLSSTTGILAGVVLPDASRWTFNNVVLGIVAPVDDRLSQCGTRGGLADQPAIYTSTVTNPAGLTGTFERKAVWHARSYVPSWCTYDSISGASNEGIPPVFGSYALVSRKFVGPGVPSQTWTYAYSAAQGSTTTDACAASGSCVDSATVDITAPDGNLTRHAYSTRWGATEGKVTRIDSYQGTSTLLRTQSTLYAATNAGPFPAQLGHSFNGLTTNAAKLETWSPVRESTTLQQGVSFTWRANDYDSFAGPASVTRSSSLGYARTDATTYHHNLAKWVIGQVSGSVNVDTGLAESRTDYDTNALPWRTYSFGKLGQTFGYLANGMLSTVTDGRGNATTFSNWKRGIPQLIQFPATPDQPGGSSKSATVSDHGWITSVTDENGFATSYRFDAMGRLAGVEYPGGDSVAWVPKSIEFRAMTDSDWRPPGIASGQWRQSVVVGNYAKQTYFDAMWRPVVSHEYDASNGATLRSVSMAYDASGRLVFQSYPSSEVIPGPQGVTTSYDALDRVTQSEQTSELGTLFTRTEYLPGFQTRVTNPRGVQTTSGYHAYDQPSYEQPVWIVQPQGAITEVFRNVFGSPTMLRRRNADRSQQVDRQYVYDGHQQLCKVIEPEVGSTIMDYDATGNVAWTATGHVLADAGNCNTAEGYWWGRRVDRAYDSRNRLKTLTFPDGRGDQAWSYTPDGLPSLVTTYNDSSNGAAVTNAYVYNRRRLMTGESVAQRGWYEWGIGYGHDANGSLASQSYPTGLAISFAPNALGQPTQVTAPGVTYASGVQYHASGALRQFTYGNGIVHTMVQNARQLPARSTDAGIIDFDTSFDQNGNPTAILDRVRGDHYSRWMAYDGLDRLTDAGSCSFGGDCWHRFTYDTVDNIKSWKLGGVKDYANYYYEPGTNRLASIQNSSGASVVGLGYDPQGNLANKNGQQYQFDYGNRLRASAELEWYRYDGQGRRILNWRWRESGVLSQYSLGGQMVYDENHRTSGRKANEYIYLAGSLLAVRSRSFDTNVISTRYQHTDALGSPVAVTNEAGQVVERTDFEPFGSAINKPAYDGVGYTGHVMDGATGLTYMQQRYYDPGIGRFLSVDPVATDSNTGAMFNRYWYANNNPYWFTDPDGRMSMGIGSSHPTEERMEYLRRKEEAKKEQEKRAKESTRRQRTASIRTYMRSGKTVLTRGGLTTQWPSRNAVSRRSLPGAGGAYRSKDVYPTEGPYKGKDHENEYGPNDILKTDDARGRWLHGGGTGLPDSLAPQQGWKPTLGCTRMQNADIQELVDMVREFKAAFPEQQIPYERVNQ